MAQENETITKSDVSSETKEDSVNEGMQLSKRQRKKLERKKHWESVKLEKRAGERRRLKEKRRQQRENGEALPVSRKRLKHNTMEHSKCRLRVAIDCSFDDLMEEKDIFNMVRQLNYAYAANRRAPNPMQFYVTGVEKKTKARLDSLGDSKHWDINVTEKGYTEAFGAENVVYLSSDSSNVLDTLEEDKAYIIGGLVDHNHHKGLCLKLAEERGLAHAQLPVSEFVNMKTRHVLTVNQVFEILLYYTESKNWEEAFFRAIPQRKGVQSKPQQISEDNNSADAQSSKSSQSSDQDDNSQERHEMDCTTETELVSDPGLSKQENVAESIIETSEDIGDRSELGKGTEVLGKDDNAPSPKVNENKSEEVTDVSEDNTYEVSTEFKETKQIDAKKS